MRFNFSFSIVVVLLFALAFSASAAPLTLDYTIAPQTGGVYQYNFKLVNTGLLIGTGVDWIVFGDVRIPGWDGTGETPKGYGSGQFGGPPWAANFVLTGTSSTNPWSDVTSTGGYHNGPTLGPIWDNGWVLWTPGIYEMIEWSGTSSTFVPDLKFSALIVQGGDGRSIEFQDARLTPEPATYGMMGLGLAGLGLLSRRKK